MAGAAADQPVFRSFLPSSCTDGKGRTNQNVKTKLKLLINFCDLRAVDRMVHAFSAMGWASGCASRRHPRAGGTRQPAVNAAVWTRALPTKPLRTQNRQFGPWCRVLRAGANAQVDGQPSVPITPPSHRRVPASPRRSRDAPKPDRHADVDCVSRSPCRAPGVRRGSLPRALTA